MTSLSSTDTARWHPAWPDVLRAGALLSVPAAITTDGVIGGALMLLVLGGAMIPVALGAHPAFDAALGTTMLGAAWAALLDGYARIAWLDLAVHTVLTGLLAALVALLVHRLGLLSSALTPRTRRSVVVAAAFLAGVALAALWEIGEWWGHTRLDSRIQVGYGDTMTDLVAGILGAGVAALLAARVLVPASPRPGPGA